MLRHVLLATLVASLGACSSSSKEDDSKLVASPPDPGVQGEIKQGEIRQSETWKSGITLSGVVAIYNGATVEIEPGAQIKCTSSARILVAGTLKVNAAANHAK